MGELLKFFPLKSKFPIRFWHPNFYIMAIRFLLLCLFVHGFLSGQKVYRGLVLDSLTLRPLRYANFLWNDGQGAISNEEGGYELFLDTQDDSLIRLSHIGYRDLQLKVQDLKDTIYLSPTTYKLDEIVLIDTEDLKNKILSNFQKNLSSETRCKQFFYKQFLKENDKYVNYLEAIGKVEKYSKKEDQVIYLEGVRKTDNLITSYINFKFQSLSRLFERVSQNIVDNGEITDYDWVSPLVIEATVRDYRTKTEYLLTINTEDYSIQKVMKNDITNELNKKIFSKTMYIENEKREVEGFLQGEVFEYDFKKIGDQYILNRIYHKGKGILLSKDKSIKHSFLSEQLYITTDVSANCHSKKGLTRLRAGKSLAKVNAKYEGWSSVNSVLPLKEQKQILSTLGKVE